MTSSRFNDGWRKGCADALFGRVPEFREAGYPGGVARVVGPSEPLDEGLWGYAQGYVGGYAAKTDSPPTHAPDPEPVTLGTLVRQIEKLRITWLLGGGDEEDATVGLDSMAEQHYLLAIGALEQAQRFATLADLHQARALGEQRSIR